MSYNTLTAIENIISNPTEDLRAYYRGRNRANNMGEALEEYIKDMFAGTFTETDDEQRKIRFSQVFSYKGNQNNPPDVMIYQGDAIEVKKIENAGSALALNSSYPKAKLFSNNPKISETCRLCEQWGEKDILYTVGVVAKGGKLRRLFFVYGIDYAASAETYERLERYVKSEINAIPDIEWGKTKELGRVNRVDPLGITKLRVRGMWSIENPAKVFSYIYTPTNAQFEFIAVINNDKYNSFPEADRKSLEARTNDNFKIIGVSINTPDNPVELKQAKLITFHR